MTAEQAVDRIDQAIIEFSLSDPGTMTSGSVLVEIKEIIINYRKDQV